MKRSLLVLAIGVCLACPLMARPEGGGEGGGGMGRHWGGGGANLTQEERTELKAAHEAAEKENPDLAKEAQDLREQFRAHEKKMHDAMVKADPKVEPILAKMKQGGEGHHDGPPPAASDDNN